MSDLACKLLEGDTGLLRTLLYGSDQLVKLVHLVKLLLNGFAESFLLVDQVLQNVEQLRDEVVVFARLVMSEGAAARALVLILQVCRPVRVAGPTPGRGGCRRRSLNGSGGCF